MRKLIIALTVFATLIFSHLTQDIRVIKGEVTSRTYIEEGDYTNTWLATTDGEVWIAEGYIAPIGDKVLIVYDRCDKSTIYDDEIKYIIHFTDFTR